MRYTATLNKNFRDTKSTTPKVLLTDITTTTGEEFRDHCWVDLTTKLEAFVPAMNTDKVLIEFSAREKEYRGYGSEGEEKVTLKRIRDIQIIK